MRFAHVCELSRQSISNSVFFSTLFLLLNYCVRVIDAISFSDLEFGIVNSESFV